MKWSAWKSVLAGAVIGFVEAAGPEAARRRIHGPLAVVRIDDRRVPDTVSGTGLWFLDPLGDPRSSRADDRRGTGAPLRLLRIHPGRLLRGLWPSAS